MISKRQMCKETQAQQRACEFLMPEPQILSAQGRRERESLKHGQKRTSKGAPSYNMARTKFPDAMNSLTFCKIKC